MSSFSLSLVLMLFQIVFLWFLQTDLIDVYQEMEDTIVYGNVTETGYIVTTIAGRNGQPNQVL